jgi:hypothetical protein
MVKRCKNLFRGVFNYARSVEPVMYRHAFTERQAWKLFCDEIAKRHEVHPSHVYALFDGSQRNHEITIETEFKEVDDGK